MAEKKIDDAKLEAQVKAVDMVIDIPFRPYLVLMQCRMKICSRRLSKLVRCCTVKPMI
jgi:hypothetical protein